MAEPAESVVVEIKAKMDKFERDLSKVQSLALRGSRQMEQGFARLNAPIQTATQSLSKMHGVLTLITSSALTLFIKNMASAGAEIKNTSEQLGISAKKLQELRYAATASGVGVGEVDQILRVFSRNLGDTSGEVTQFVRAVGQLGLKASDLRKMLPEDAWDAVAAQFSKLEKSTEQSAIGFDVFGRASQRAINLIRLGPAAMRELVEEGKRLGVFLSDETVKKTDAINTQFERLGAAFKAAGIEVTESFKPAVDAIVNMFLDPKVRTGLKSFTTELSDLVILMVENKEAVITFAGALTGMKLGKAVGGGRGALLGLVTGGAAAAAETGALDKLLPKRARSFDEFMERVQGPGQSGDSLSRLYEVVTTDLIKRIENTPPGVRGKAGEISEYQIMPATARGLGFDPNKLTDSDYAKRVAQTFLDQLSHKFASDFEAVLVGYNAGEFVASQFVKSGFNKEMLPKATQKYLERAYQLTGRTEREDTAAPPGSWAPTVTIQDQSVYNRLEKQLENLPPVEVPAVLKPVEPKDGKGGIVPNFDDQINKAIQDLELRASMLGTKFTDLGFAEGFAELFDSMRFNGLDTFKELSKGLDGLTEKFKELNTAQAKVAGAAVWQETRTSLERYNMEMAKLNNLIKANGIDQDTFNRKAFQLAFPGLAQAIDDATNLRQQLDQLAVGGVDRLTDSITEFTLGTKTAGEAFKDFANQLVSDLLRITTRMLLLQSIGSIAGQPTNLTGGGGGILGVLGGLIGGLFGGGGQGMGFGQAGGAGSLLGFAGGGTFPVTDKTAAKLRSGTDGHLVQFWADEGEIVTITPRGKNPHMGMGLPGRMGLRRFQAGGGFDVGRDQSADTTGGLAVNTAAAEASIYSGIANLGLNLSDLNPSAVNAAIAGVATGQMSVSEAMSGLASGGLMGMETSDFVTTRDEEGRATSNVQDRAQVTGTFSQAAPEIGKVFGINPNERRDLVSDLTSFMGSLFGGLLGTQPPSTYKGYTPPNPMEPVQPNLPTTPTTPVAPVAPTTQPTTDEEYQATADLAAQVGLTPGTLAANLFGIEPPSPPSIAAPEPNFIGVYQDPQDYMGEFGAVATSGGSGTAGSAGGPGASSAADQGHGGVGPGGGGESGPGAAGAAGTLHNGGSFSVGSFSDRMAQNVLRSLPRMHDGGVVQEDEFPAILQRGEEVLTEEESRRIRRGLAPGNARDGRNPGANVMVNVNNRHRNAAVDVSESSGPNGMHTLEVWIEEKVASSLRRRESPVNRAMRNNFAAREQLVRR